MYDAQPCVPHGSLANRGSSHIPVNVLGGVKPLVPLVGGMPLLGGKYPFASWKLWAASDNCLRLLRHCVLSAASRTFCTAGSSRPISTAMIAMTTNSSMSVKPCERLRRNLITRPPREEGRQNRVFGPGDATFFERLVERRHDLAALAGADGRADRIRGRVGQKPHAAVEEHEIHPARVSAAEADQVRRVRSGVRNHWVKREERRAAEQVVPVLGVRRTDREDTPAAVTVVAGVLVVAVPLADRGGVAGTVGDVGDPVLDVLVERPVVPGVR